MITGRLEHTGIDRLIQKISDRGGDLARPLSSCGEIMLTSISKNFEAQGRYSTVGDVMGGSTRWQKLAPRTVYDRLGGSRAFRRDGRLRKSAQRKYEGMKILQRSGRLAGSFSKLVSGNTLTIGSNVVYAAIHHYGGKAGRKNAVTIPARPILVVQDEDIEDMLDILGRYIFKP